MNTKIKLVALLFLLSSLFFAFSPSETRANTPGNVMSDFVFRNHNSMTEAEIQTFLVARGSFLANYRIPADAAVGPRSGPNNEPLVIPAGTLASRVIWLAAQWYQINPQVIIATIQKEQSSITARTQAWPGQVYCAMGYEWGQGCLWMRDNRPALWGFAPQVVFGTWQLRFDFERSRGNNAWYPTFNFNGCHINTWCIVNVQVGRAEKTSVLIENATTAALYNYTPYISVYSPNSNFAVMFNAWFVPNNYALHSVSGQPSSMVSGQTVVATLSLRNTGRVPWQSDSTGTPTPMRLNVLSGNNLSSGDHNWIGSTRIRMASATVQPGEIGVFNISLRMPEVSGVYTLRFVPLIENVTGVSQPPLTDIGMQFVINNPTGRVFRFWSDANQTHFYTFSQEEKAHILRTWPRVWSYERQDFMAFAPSVSGTVPVYRFWSDRLQSHFYTANWNERQRVIATLSSTWRYEGVVFHVNNLATPASRPVHRFWSDVKQSHFYTSSESERAHVLRTWPNVWRYEGVAWFTE